jgi:hypothetical protein
VSKVVAGKSLKASAWTRKVGTNPVTISDYDVSGRFFPLEFDSNGLISLSQPDFVAIFCCYQLSSE